MAVRAAERASTRLCSPATSRSRRPSHQPELCCSCTSITSKGRRLISCAWVWPSGALGQCAAHLGTGSANLGRHRNRRPSGRLGAGKSSGPASDSVRHSGQLRDAMGAAGAGRLPRRRRTGGTPRPDCRRFPHDPDGGSPATRQRLPDAPSFSLQPARTGPPEGSPGARRRPQHPLAPQPT